MVWVAGFILAIIYAMCGMIRLRRLVREVVCVRENIYICDAVKSPFILGIVRPRVYLSSSLSEKDMNYIIAHEAAHLKRKDHWWKPLGYSLLCIYWFNPLCWAAYVMLCKDIELACDEKLAKDMTFLEKKEYSEVLLSYAQQRRMVIACPLAFGEVGVMERVKSVLKYKRPPLWIRIAAIAGCAVMAVCFLTNPINRVSGNEVDPSAASDAGSDRFVSKKLTQNTVIMDEVFAGKAKDRYDEDSYAQVSIGLDKKTVTITLFYNGTMSTAVLDGTCDKVSSTDGVGYVGVYEGFISPIQSDLAASEEEKMPIIADITFTDSDIYAGLTIGYADEARTPNILIYGDFTAEIANISNTNARQAGIL